MTTYGFAHCGEIHTKEFPMGTAPAFIACPTCGENANRSFSAPAIIFNGAGFYKTDSKTNR